MTSKIIYAVLFSTLALSGCVEKTTEAGNTVTCLTVFVPALRIEVLDKETGLANACGASIKLQNGNFIQELSGAQNIDCDNGYIFSSQDQRAGVYSVTVSKPGYQDWVRENITVTENICYPNTVTLQAYLEK